MLLAYCISKINFCACRFDRFISNVSIFRIYEITENNVFFRRNEVGAPKTSVDIRCSLITSFSLYLFFKQMSFHFYNFWRKTFSSSIKIINTLDINMGNLLKLLKMGFSSSKLASKYNPRIPSQKASNCIEMKLQHTSYSMLITITCVKYFSFINIIY